MSDATPRRCRLVVSSQLVRSCIHSLLVALLLGLPPVVAKERQDLASELPDDTVVCVDVPSIPYRACHTASTSFGRILTHPRVAPIARSALESLEPRYFAPSSSGEDSGLRDIVSRNRDRIESKRYRSIDYFVFRQPFRIELDDPTRPTLANWNSPESRILRRPSNCFTVIGTDLIYSDHVNALKQAIEATRSPIDRLHELLSFRLVRTHVRRSRSSTIVGESYWDPSEGWRNLHSLFTKDEMLSAIKNYRNPFMEVSTLSSALERRKEVRFHEIAKYIAPCGSVISVSGNDIEWKFIMPARDSARK